MTQLNKSLIVGLQVFAGLRADDLDFVLANARSIRVLKEDFVFEQGRDAHSFYLLLYGHVRVERTTPDGQKIVACFISEGELIGIAVALGQSHYPATAVAAVDCTVLVWPNSQWAILSARVPALSGNVMKTIGSRIQETQAKVLELATERVEQRVAHALLRLVRQTGRKLGTAIEIDFPISRQDIAEMTGTTVFSVSRILSDWEVKGLIKGGRQQIIVLEPHRLLLIAEGRA